MAGTTGIPYRRPLSLCSRPHAGLKGTERRSIDKILADESLKNDNKHVQVGLCSRGFALLACTVLLGDFWARGTFLDILGKSKKPWHELHGAV